MNVKAACTHRNQRPFALIVRKNWSRSIKERRSSQHSSRHPHFERILQLGLFQNPTKIPKCALHTTVKREIRRMGCLYRVWSVRPDFWEEYFVAMGGSEVWCFIAECQCIESSLERYHWQNRRSPGCLDFAWAKLRRRNRTADKIFDGPCNIYRLNQLGVSALTCSTAYILRIASVREMSSPENSCNVKMKLSHDDLSMEPLQQIYRELTSREEICVRVRCSQGYCPAGLKNRSNQP